LPFIDITKHDVTFQKETHQDLDEWLWT